MSELITTTNTRPLSGESPFLLLDPLDLIARSGRAERTKAEYTKALKPYLDDGGNLLDVEALVSYADGLCGSRRACLRAAVKIWIDKTKSIIKATANPARATP
jgi:hypothetical protein